MNDIQFSQMMEVLDSIDLSLKRLMVLVSRPSYAPALDVFHRIKRENIMELEELQKIRDANTT